MPPHAHRFGVRHVDHLSEAVLGVYRDEYFHGGSLAELAG
jgi:hypothetical protein